MAYNVAFWNLENLYAPEDYGEREPWIAKAMAYELKGWDQNMFQQKVANLSAVIAHLDSGAGPDLLGVCEVENRFALVDMVYF